MQRRLSFKIALVVAVIWAMTVNHCFLESVFAWDSEPVHHEGADSHSHGEPCESGMDLARASYSSIEQALPVTDLQFSLSNFVTCLRKLSTQANAPTADERNFEVSHSSAFATLLSAPNAPPFQI